MERQVALGHCCCTFPEQVLNLLSFLLPALLATASGGPPHASLYGIFLEQHPLDGARPLKTALGILGRRALHTEWIEALSLDTGCCRRVQDY